MTAPHRMVFRDISRIGIATLHADRSESDHVITDGFTRQTRCVSAYCESATCGIDTDGDTALLIEHHEEPVRFNTRPLPVPRVDRTDIHAFSVPGIALAVTRNPGLDTVLTTQPVVVIQVWGTEPKEGKYPSILFPGLVVEELSIVSNRRTSGQGILFTVPTNPVELPWSAGRLPWTDSTESMIAGRVDQLPEVTHPLPADATIHPALDDR